MHKVSIDGAKSCSQMHIRESVHWDEEKSKMDKPDEKVSSKLSSK